MRSFLPFVVGLVLALAGLVLFLTYRQQARAREAADAARLRSEAAAEDATSARSKRRDRSRASGDATRSSSFATRATPATPATPATHATAATLAPSDAELADAIAELRAEVAGLREDVRDGFAAIEAALLAGEARRDRSPVPPVPDSDPALVPGRADAESIAELVRDGMTMLNRWILGLESGAEPPGPGVDLPSLYAAREELAEVETLDELVAWRKRYAFLDE